MHNHPRATTEDEDVPRIQPHGLVLLALVVVYTPKRRIWLTVHGSAATTLAPVCGTRLTFVAKVAGEANRERHHRLALADLHELRILAVLVPALFER